MARIRIEDLPAAEEGLTAEELEQLEGAGRRSFPPTLEGRETYLPGPYPRSHEHPDDQVKLGHANDWLQADGGPVLGAGARTFLVGDDGVAVTDWRDLTLG